MMVASRPRQNLRKGHLDLYEIERQAGGIEPGELLNAQRRTARSYQRTRSQRWMMALFVIFCGLFLGGFVYSLWIVTQIMMGAH